MSPLSPEANTFAEEIITYFQEQDERRDQETIERLSAQMEDQLERMRQTMARLEPVSDRDIAQKGDWAQIDYDGVIDGGQFPGSKAENVSVEISEGELIKGNIAGLEGVKVGEFQDVDYTFGADYPVEEVRGKTARFHIRLKGLKRQVTPELGRAFELGIDGKPAPSRYDYVQSRNRIRIPTASLGVRVTIHEMRPVRPTAVHKTDRLAELVCSNSLRGDKLDNAVGLLKEEMRRLDSIVLRMAEANRVPAGAALAVDREQFAASLTEAIQTLPSVRVLRQEVGVRVGQHVRGLDHPHDPRAAPDVAGQAGVAGRIEDAGPHAIADNFGAPRPEPGGGFHWHQGNDIMAAKGTPILAPFDGVASVSRSALGGLAGSTIGVLCGLVAARGLAEAENELTAFVRSGHNGRFARNRARLRFGRVSGVTSGAVARRHELREDETRLDDAFRQQTPAIERQTRCVRDPKDDACFIALDARRNELEVEPLLGESVLVAVGMVAVRPALEDAFGERGVHVRQRGQLLFGGHVGLDQALLAAELRKCR